MDQNWITPEEQLDIINRLVAMINCFCMFSDYQPMTLDEWIEIDRKRRKAMDAETTLSAASLTMMDSTMENYKRGIVSEPIEMENDFEGE